MEKEIKVRKKRFAAFWLMLALVCSLVVPMAVSAQDYSVDDSSLSGQTLVAGDTMTYTSSDGTTATYSIYYKSSDGETTYYTDSASYNAKYAVLDITDSKLSMITPQNGSTFAGWYVDEVYISSGILYSVTLTARFTPNTYLISYELNGGENAASNPTSYTYGTGVASFANASKEGHDFDGWYSEADFTNKVESIDETKTGVVTLYAKFTPKTYSITYEPNGGTHENAVSSYTYGVGIDSFAPATKEGYTFEGWYSDAEFKNPVTSIGTTQTGEITLYAKFEILPIVIEAGNHNLTAGVKYKLGSGVTKVNDDTSEYVSGSTFYVPEDGSYTFS